MDIMELIIQERNCCRFIDFRIDVAAAEGPVSLSLTGPEGTREFVENVFLIHKT